MLEPISDAQVTAQARQRARDPASVLRGQQAAMRATLAELPSSPALDQARAQLDAAIAAVLAALPSTES